jgi:hypothetical protein
MLPKARKPIKPSIIPRLFRPRNEPKVKKNPQKVLSLKWPGKTVFAKFHPPSEKINYLEKFAVKGSKHPNKLVRNSALFAEYFRSPEFEKFVYENLRKHPVGTVAKIYSDRKFNGGNAKIIIYVKKTGQGPDNYVIQDYEIVIWSSGNPHVKDPSKIINLPSSLFSKFRDLTYSLSSNPKLPQDLAKELLPYFEKIKSQILVFSLPYPEQNPYFFTKFTIKRDNDKLLIVGISTKIVTSRQTNL